ncbi:methionine/alanine import family NSS transporter small subunit [Actinorugispora endophytica]|uniref:Putative methionine/alanine importer small subunit n=1 Tax=Actinorugispora endophytica TaxID=1605990 RepID=A0A4R6V4U1_9ACTN|nr:methionine/alanine import family NSS transporter small subunit [Actinorugispora endophytica]TDQ55445.1 putative methionine/alanine importer small subunit [Actinorugispora endophytica]
MSTSAVVMMIVSIVIVWGGLVAAIVQLRRHPERPEDETPAGPGV